MKRSFLLRIFLGFLLASQVGTRFINLAASASPGDLNEDGVVDKKDLTIVAGAYGSYPGHPGWNPKADLNEDASVDMIDVAVVAIECRMNSSSRISGLGGLSASFSEEEKGKICEGLVDLPEIFVSFTWWAPDVSALHEKNPDKKILVYRNLRKVRRDRTEKWASSADWRLAEYEFARNNNIICKDSAGNDVYSTTYGRNYLLADIGNPKWHRFLADWIKFYIDNYDYDGVFLDNGLSVREGETYWGASAKPINPRTGTYYTENEIIQYHIQVHTKIRETIGSDKLVICNGIYYGERFFKRQEDYMKILNRNVIDGFMSEGLFGEKRFWGEDRWLKSVEFISWLQDNWLSKGKFFVPHVNWHIPKTQTDQELVWVGFEEGYSLEHSVTFHFASTLLAINPEVSELNLFSVDGCWYKPFAEKLYSLDLGEPIADYQRIGDKHVYMRKFEKGLVVVNPTTSSHTISLDKNYRTLDGRILSSLTIRGYQGVILLVV